MTSDSHGPTSSQPDDGEDRSVLSRSARDPDRTWAYGTGHDQVADVYRPAGGERNAEDGDRSPVILVHGGFWRPEYDRMHVRPMAAALADLGYPVLVPEYARCPGDPERTLDDLRRVLTEASGVLGAVPPVLVGHSAGGHLVLVLAGDPDAPTGGVLALAPVADLADAEQADLDQGAVRDFLGGPAWLKPDLDPCRRGRPKVRVRVIHGMADGIVPIRLSERYSARSHVAVSALPGVGHFALIDPRSSAWPTVLSELAALDGSRVLND